MYDNARSDHSMTAYDILGVSPSASQQQLRAGYLDAIRLSHPDHASGASDRERRTAHAAQLNRAWQLLRDPERRRNYDAELILSHTARAASVAPAAPVWASTPPPVQQPASSTTSTRSVGGPSLNAGPLAWMILAAIAVLAAVPFSFLASGSLLTHAANWVLVAALFQLVGGGRSSPLAIVARLAIRVASTMLPRNGAPDSLRHSWHSTRS